MRQRDNIQLWVHCLVGIAGVMTACLSPFPEFDDYAQTATTDMGQTATASEVVAEVECNGIDDDRDNRVDEFVDPSCELGTGNCRTAGTKRCVPNGSSVLIECAVDDLPIPQAEDCAMSLDEDCDGQVDEGCACIPGNGQSCYSGVAQFRGVGACAEGEQVCASDGTLGPCVGDRMPESETCDGIDNDCDGEVDEGGFSCLVNACRGNTTCVDGRLMPCEVSLSAEVCDGQDNDCDGRSDEDVALDNRACPVVDDCQQLQVCESGVLRCEDNPTSDCLCTPLSTVSSRHVVCIGAEYTYGDALAFCQSQGLGRLAQLTENVEHRAVFHGLKSLGLDGVYWVGGTRSGREATWENGTTIEPVLFSLGSLDEPNQQNRVAFQAATGLYETRASNAVRPFICELPCNEFDTDGDRVSECDGDCRPSDVLVHPNQAEQPNDNVDNNCNGVTDEHGLELCQDRVDNDADGRIDEGVCAPMCKDMWFDDRMYVACNVGKLWDEAVEACATLGGQLAEFERFTEWRQLWAWLGQIVPPSRWSYWFGLQRASGGRWRFRNGAEISVADEIWRSWADGQPDGADASEDCAQLWCNPIENGCNGTWNDDQCENPRYYVCETI